MPTQSVLQLILAKAALWDLAQEKRKTSYGKQICRRWSNPVRIAALRMVTRNR